MKSIALVLFLSITTLTISNNILDNYKVNLFIISLKREGIFDIIKSIKMVYGQEAAIISCEELNINNCGDCKKVVTDYMPRPDLNVIKIQNGTSIDELIGMQRILRKKLSSEETKLIYERIVNRLQTEYIEVLNNTIFLN